MHDIVLLGNALISLTNVPLTRVYLYEKHELLTNASLLFLDQYDIVYNMYDDKTAADAN